MVRIFVGRVIGQVAGSNTTMSAQLPSRSSPRFLIEMFRGKRSHFPDRVFEPEHFFVAHITTENARIVAVTARVGDAFVKTRMPLSAAIMVLGCRMKARRSSSLHAVKNSRRAPISFDLENHFDLVIDGLAAPRLLRGFNDVQSIQRFVVPVGSDDGIGIICRFPDGLNLLSFAQ